MNGTLIRLPSGILIDGWRVLKELGDGGFAVVYLVEKNGQRRALKVARHREASGDEKQTHARSKRELTVLSMLAHPNIVTLCGHGYAEAGNFYLALEYVDGWTLGEWKERKHPTFHEILRVCVKIAAALAYMHSRGILHRDLKLSNVLIRKSDGDPIIIDFSCATYTQAADLTESGLPPGTDRFRAPEQFSFLREHRDEQRARYAFQVADEIWLSCMSGGSRAVDGGVHGERR
jgi:eukaryotic-like serine/threonine-protein kinase